MRSAQSGAKETRTRTTGRPWARKASASEAVRATTSGPVYGWVDAPTMPFWRSIATRAVRGSRVVGAMGQAFRGVTWVTAGGGAAPAGVNGAGPCGPAGSARCGRTVAAAGAPGAPGEGAV